MCSPRVGTTRRKSASLREVLALERTRIVASSRQKESDVSPRIEGRVFNLLCDWKSSKDSGRTSKSSGGRWGRSACFVGSSSVIFDFCRASSGNNSSNREGFFTAGCCVFFSGAGTWAERIGAPGLTFVVVSLAGIWATSFGIFKGTRGTNSVVEKKIPLEVASLDLV